MTTQRNALEAARDFLTTRYGGTHGAQAVVPELLATIDAALADANDGQARYAGTWAWLPLHTGPRDGTKVLVRDFDDDKPDVHTASWKTLEGIFTGFVRSDGQGVSSGLWCPLPLPDSSRPPDEKRFTAALRWENNVLYVGKIKIGNTWSTGAGQHGYLGLTGSGVGVSRTDLSTKAEARAALEAAVLAMGDAL